VRPTCQSCPSPKHMTCAHVFCGPFAWRAHFCADCKDAFFETLSQRIGFRLTKFLFKGKVLMHDAHLETS
jgi:hypothetical protein